MKGMRALLIIGALFLGLDFAFAQEGCDFGGNPPAVVVEYMNTYHINSRHFESQPASQDCINQLPPGTKVLLIKKQDDGAFTAKVFPDPTQIARIDIVPGAFILTRK